MIMRKIKIQVILSIMAVLMFGACIESKCESRRKICKDS